MEKTENPENSGVSESTEGETKPEGGDSSEVASGEKEEEGQIPAEDSSEDNTDDPAEEPAEEVVDPTTDPETPAESEEPTDIEGGSTVDGAEIMEETPVTNQTINIADWAKENDALKDKVDVKASVEGSEVTIADDGKIIVEKDKILVLNIVPKAGYKMTNGTAEDVTGPAGVKKNGSNYSFKVTADASVTIAVEVIQYTLSVDAAKAAGLKIKLDDSLKADLIPAVTGDTAVEIGDSESKVLKGGSVAKELKFTVTRKEEQEQAGKLHVYAKYDGSADMDELTAGDVSVDTTSKTTTYPYTISAGEIAALDESVAIVLVDEAKTPVAVAADSDEKAEVQFKTVKDSATSTATEGWVASDGSADTGLVKVDSAFAGGTFEFKAAVKDANASTYAIDKVEVKNGSKDVAVSEKDGVYSFTMPEVTGSDQVTIKVTTVVSATSGHSLTFTIDGDKGSATAVITKIVTTVTPEKGDPTEKVYTVDGTGEGKGDLSAYVGLADLALKAGEAKRIPQPAKNETVKSVEVKVTPAVGGVYQLTKLTGEDNAPATRTYTFTKGLTTETDIAKKLEEAVTLSVKTEVIAATEAKTFSIAKEKDGDADAATHLTITAPTGVTEKELADKSKYYEVPSTLAHVEFKVTAEPGYELDEDKLLTQANKGALRSIDPTADGDKTVYTVSLYTAKLGTAEVTGDTPAVAVPVAVTVAEKASQFTVKINPDKEGNEQGPIGFEVTTRRYTETGENKTPVDVTGASTLSYGGKYEATIEPMTGNRLKEVSYTVNGGEKIPVTPEPNEKDVDIAKIEINPLKGNVIITVETEADYDITPLLAVDSEGKETKVPVESDESYVVDYKQAYLFGLKQGGEVIDVTTDIRAEVKDETGAKVTVPRVVVLSTTNSKKMLKINLASKPALRGKEITVDMLVKGEVVATYYLTVKKATTAITINEGKEIKQNVGTTMYYPVTFDGEGVSAMTDESSNTLKGVTTRITPNGKLAVTVPDMAFDNAVVAETDKDGKKTIKSYKEAVITVSATDNDVEQTVKVTAEPLFNPTDKPTVAEVTNGVSDTTIWVTVGGMNDRKPETEGNVYYEVTAKAQAKVGDVNFSGSDAAKVLVDEVTETVNVTKDNGTYRVKLNVGKAGTKLGAGAQWTYDVTAKLVYENVEESAVSEKAPVSTVDTYFASALKLTKDKTCYKGNLYSGQSSESGLRIAKPTFTDKKVNYKIVDEYIEHDDELKVGLDDEGYLVVKSVDSWATVGKHTITVMATADETTNHTMYASRATITVNVVRGIESLYFNKDFDRLYKVGGSRPKAATLKMASSLVYNDTDKKYQPKVKKVTWSVIGADSYDERGNVDIEDVTPAPAGITVKNGTVTVAKDFVVDTNPRHVKNNQFGVLVQAADYEGNTTYGCSGIITVTSESLDVTNLVAAKYDSTTKKYTVLAVQSGKTANKVNAKDIDDAYVYVLTNPATAGAVYTQAQWNRLGAISAENFTFTTSNKKILGVDYDGELSAYGAGKKVNIKVTANDGGKKSNTLILDLGWTDTEGMDLALKVTARGDDGTWTTLYDPKKVDADAKVNYSAAGTPKLYYTVMKGNKNDGTSTTFTVAENYTNCKVSVKGAKLIKDGYNEWYYVMNAENTIITLTDPNVPKGTKAKTYKVTLTNAAYSRDLPKAAVKFTKGSTLHESALPTEQELPMTVMNGKASFGANMVAKVEIDWSAITAKNWHGYYELTNAIDSGKSGAAAYFDLNKDDGSTKLTFDTNDDYYTKTELVPGSYRLKVTVGQLSSSKFTPKSQAATVTVKVAKNKDLTFKPVTSYKLSGVDGAAVLTGKSNVNVKAGEKVRVDYDELQNANVDGKSNLFTHYFKVEQDEKSGTWYLKLNLDDELVKDMMYNTVKNADGTDKVENGKKVYDDATYHIPDLTTIDKKNLTGYLTYTTYVDEGNTYYNYTGKEDGTVKITVKPVANPKADAKSVKPSQKYVPGNTELGLAAGSEMPVNITVNNTYVAMSYAMIDADKKNNEELTLGGTNGVDAKTGQVVLKVGTGKTLADGTKYSTNLLVVPENSLYKAMIDKAPATAPAAQAEDTTSTAPTTLTKTDLIKKYGVAVKVTVVGKTKPTPTEAPKPVNPTPGQEDQEIPAEVISAVTGLTEVEITNETDVTVTTDSNTTARLTSTGVAKIKTAVEGVAPGYTAAVTDALSEVNVTEGAGTAKATVKLSKTGYVAQDVQVNVKIVKGGTTTTPVVTSIKIFKDSNEASDEEINVKSGEQTITYTAKVYDKDGTSEIEGAEVEWNVEVGTATSLDPATNFAEDTPGKLTISASQDTGTLIVTATSKTESTVFARLTLTIKNE